MSKHILILNTGGTISCIKSKEGLIPTQGYVEQVLSSSSRLKHADLPRFTIKEYQPLIDSSNMTVEHWNQLARDIKGNYDDFDGFILFHGTDTMAYTASALSFMLHNLGKPVILTGSQLPLSEIRSDAMDNTISALMLSANFPIYEVCIYFNQKLLRGNRARKLSSHRFDAFGSPNFQALGHVGVALDIQKQLLLPKPKAPFSLQLVKKQVIANFSLFPGFSIKPLEAIVSSGIQALVLESYGTGNAPNQNEAFVSLLKSAIDKNILIVNITQCPYGHVESHFYATGRILEEIGVINAHDMTPEAVHCKLIYVCSQTDNLKKRIQWMRQSLRGEMSLKPEV